MDCYQSAAEFLNLHGKREGSLFPFLKKYAIIKTHSIQQAIPSRLPPPMSEPEPGRYRF
ncbi:hypothetical protein HOLDEFILI_02103 [Holdemania filiformis DSM 12042]|uniref:Uncharacterized protein n=1 Tax=Holdemania filiformis DSM 12042 TaxID=545696 RepID=B9Y8F6_9FIRM|nr:hypothetical protein HOLDEFILI_02103 [Holdemania filiformis DSM 12042]